MKTNKILMAVALAAGFTACTSEDIVENNSVNLEARKALPSMTLTLGESVDSRFAWDLKELAWNKFTAEDKFGAGLMDTELFTTLGAAPLTNYIFSTEDGKSYSTTSQMVEGTYFFYSYDGFEKSASRKAIEFDLTNQKSLDLTKPGEAINANQLFISPLYKLEAANANEALPVNFYSYWASAEVKIKNTSGQSFKLVRMMLESASKDANGAYDQLFELKGTLTPASLGTVAVKNSSIANLVYYYDAAEGKYVLPYKDASDKTKGRVAITDILTKDIATATKAEATMMLDCGNYEMADDEEVTAYFLVPAGNYKDINIKFFVQLESEDEDEDPMVVQLESVNAVLNIKSADTATENDRTSFQRGKTTALFGRDAEGAAIAHEIDDVDIIGAIEAGSYASSYEDLSAILKEATDDDVKVENMGDLVINEKVIKLIQKYDDIDVTFNNPIEITASTAMTLPKNLFVKNATITSGKFTAKGNLAGALTINPGAQLTIESTQTGVISNMGTVNVEANDENIAFDKKIVIKNIAKDAAGNALTTIVNVKSINPSISTVSATPAAGANNGIYLLGNPTKLYLNAVTDAAGEAIATPVYANGLTIANGQNMYVAENVTVNGSDYTKLVNKGYVENKGTINIIHNQATKPSTSYLTAKIDNYGVINWLKNEAVSATYDYAVKAIVNMESRDAKIVDFKDATINGWVNNTKGAFVVDAAQTYASYTDEEAKTGKLGNVQSIDRLIVKNCTWTDAELPNTSATIVVDNVTFETADTESPSSISWSNANVSMTNSKAKVDVTLSGATIDVTGSEFINLTAANVNKLSGVKVSKMLTISTSQALTLIGATLNNVNATALATVSVTCLTNTATDPDTHTAKTTTLNGNFVPKNGAVINVYEDATLIIENGAVVGKVNTATDGEPDNGVYVTVDEAAGNHTGHTGCVAGKVLKYGTVVE